MNPKYEILFTPTMGFSFGACSSIPSNIILTSNNLRNTPVSCIYPGGILA